MSSLSTLCHGALVVCWSPFSLNLLVHYNNGFIIDEIWPINLISYKIILYIFFLINLCKLIIFFFLGKWGHTHLLTLWAEDMNVRHVHKSTNMVIKWVNVNKYEVHDMWQKVVIVDLMERTYRCGKFQLCNIPCTHVTIVAQFNNLLDYY